MGNKKTFKSILMAGTIFAGGMLGAGETPQQVVAEPNTSNLKGLLKTLSQSVEQAENTPIEETASVQYNPLSGGRDNTKAIVQASEIYRANKGR